MSAIITSVTLTSVTAPRAGISCGHVIVEIAAGLDGVVGVGEMSDFQHLPMYHPNVADLERTINGLLVGRDVRRTNVIDEVMREAFPHSGSLYDKGSVIRGGVDIALWDARAKLLDVNVGELLGGRVREALPIAFPIFRQQSEADVEANLDIVDTMLERGFSRFRVYVGRDFALDRRFLEACVGAYGDRISIKSLDFSNLVSAQAAARFINQTSDLGFEFVEAPSRAGDVDGMRFVRDRTGIPVSEHAAGERSALALITSGAVDVLNVGLFVLGGITGAQRVLGIAEAASIPCLIGTTQELAIGTAAAAHVGTCSPGATAAGDPVGPLLYTRDVVTEPLEFRDSALVPPSGPGLGVQIDPQLLEAAHEPLSWSATDARSAIDRTGARAK
ncbi:mandelate racemase/muconate lactonizing enzyme family protein [Microbacterium invictum]|uniref:Muconate cycloisomerase n=1 Tax=Microbacterium invictum TaxID=515415 RepID=A0AA40VNE2_9MICO|nr:MULTISPECIES: enolase C-terminal domain-like protein [Microbacterium]MBB4140807.1 muconate cycloisomerase [Microbacterium invictum]